MVEAVGFAPASSPCLYLESMLTTINPSLSSASKSMLLAAHYIGKWIVLISKTPCLASRLFYFADTATPKVLQMNDESMNICVFTSSGSL